MLRICNGRKGRDHGVGNFTCIGGRGNSVIDYALCSEPLLLNITDFNIEERTESQHFPVYMSILSSIESPNVHHTNKNNKTEQ